MRSLTRKLAKSWAGCIRAPEWKCFLGDHVAGEKMALRPTAVRLANSIPDAACRFAGEGIMSRRLFRVPSSLPRPFLLFPRLFSVSRDGASRASRANLRTIGRSQHAWNSIISPVLKKRARVIGISPSSSSSRIPETTTFYAQIGDRTRKSDTYYSATVAFPSVIIKNATRGNATITRSRNSSSSGLRLRVM